MYCSYIKNGKHWRKLTKKNLGAKHNQNDNFKRWYAKINDKMLCKFYIYRTV